ncbi:hypothetical protein [Acidiphilium sp.]|uniref:hypothetical protein n=1 Tax=Acidiphilium sp. TaxID=527 RepID=UPI003CFD0E2F
MRNILMAGSALCLMGGIAFAQTPTGTTMPAHPMPMHRGVLSHRMGGAMAMNGSAGSYLHLAQQAIMSHDKTRAHVALGRAETDLLTNSYVEGSVNGPISTPAIDAIRSARKAVEGGDFQRAAMMVHKAMVEMHGERMNNAGMDKSGMMKSGMTNTGMSPSGMAKPNGVMGTLQGKQDSTMTNQMNAPKQPPVVDMSNQ